MTRPEASPTPIGKERAAATRPCLPVPALELPCDSSVLLGSPGALPAEAAASLRRGLAVVRRAIGRIRRDPIAPPEVAEIAEQLEREWEGLLRRVGGGPAPSATLEEHHERVERALGFSAGSGSALAWRIVVYDRFFSVARTAETGPALAARTCARALAATFRELRSGFLRRENVDCLLAGVEALLDRVLSGTPPPAGAGESDSEAEIHRAAPPAGDAVWRARWQNAHWGFFVLSQGVTASIREASKAVTGRDGEAAAASLQRAATLLRGATAALMLASDLPPSAYLEILRPLMREAGGERGLTGEQSLDRDQMQGALTSLLAQLKAAPLESPALRRALTSLRDALRFDAIEHALAARAVVGDLPSIVTESVGRPVSAADVLLEMARHRVEMFHFVLDLGPDAPPGRAPGRGGAGPPPASRPGT